MADSLHGFLSDKVDVISGCVATIKLLFCWLNSAGWAVTMENRNTTSHAFSQRGSKHYWPLLYIFCTPAVYLLLWPLCRRWTHSPSAWRFVAQWHVLWWTGLHDNLVKTLVGHGQWNPDYVPIRLQTEGSGLVNSPQWLLSAGPPVPWSWH